MRRWPWPSPTTARAALFRVILASALATAGGCGKPVLRVADASLGDYYTEEEFRKLSEEQREEYCRELANQRELFMGQIAEARTALERTRLEDDPRRREVDSLRTLAEDLDRRLTEALARRGAGETRPGTAARYVVRPGDTLWDISGRDEVYGGPERWPRLYRANRGRIRDPNRIYPGQEIQIPR